MSTYKFKTTNIKGKQYVEVNERIKFFRQENQYKNWGIQTDFPMLASDEVVCKCTITDTDGMVVAQGHAHELKANGMINKTSFVENCETSAVGRALAMLGIGVDTSIASANEVETAIAQQNNTKPASAKEEFKQTAKNMQENVMDKAVSYIKSQTNKQKAFDSIITKYGNDLTAKQQAGLKKFVR
tara:strand:- start:189 stop:743 length:555 start_codon:yes stop_codon:yes gene_type:complete